MVNERQPLPPHPGQGSGRPKSAPMAASSRPQTARGSTDVTRPMEMAGGDRKFYIGQFKGKTYHELAQNISHIAWAKQQNTPSKQLQDFLTWFERITGGAVELRSSLGISEETYQPRTKPRVVRRFRRTHLSSRNAENAGISPMQDLARTTCKRPVATVVTKLRRSESLL